MKLLVNTSVLPPVPIDHIAEADCTDQSEYHHKLLYHLSHIFSLLGSRIIPYYLFSHDVKKALSWQFNCCLQTAAIMKMFVSQLLNNRGDSRGENPFWLSSYLFNINIYEGQFKDELNSNPYNHAFLFGKGFPVATVGNTLPVINFYLDVARVSSPNVLYLDNDNLKFKLTDDSVVDFLTQRILIYTNRINNSKCLSVKTIDLGELLTADEFFTDKKLGDISDDVTNIARLYGMDPLNFNWKFKRRK